MISLLLSLSPLLFSRRHGRHRLLGDALVHFANLEADNGLEEAGAVVGTRERRVFEHLLRDLTVELGRRRRQVRLDVDQLLQAVELAVHLLVVWVWRV